MTLLLSLLTYVIINDMNTTVAIIFTILIATIILTTATVIIAVADVVIQCNRSESRYYECSYFYLHSRDYESHVPGPTRRKLCSMVEMLQQLSKVTAGPNGMVCAKAGDAGPSAAAK